MAVTLLSQTLTIGAGDVTGADVTHADFHFKPYLRFQMAIVFGASVVSGNVICWVDSKSGAVYRRVLVFPEILPTLNDVAPIIRQVSLGNRAADKPSQSGTALGLSGVLAGLPSFASETSPVSLSLFDSFGGGPFFRVRLKWNLTGVVAPSCVVSVENVP